MEAISKMSQRSAKDGKPASTGMIPSAARLQVTVTRSVGGFASLAREWDRLLACSATNSVFLSSGWLRAWLDVYAGDAEILIPQVRRDGALIAAAAFHVRHGIIEFVGKGRSDYLDILLDTALETEQADLATAALLDTARAAVKGFRCFNFQRIPVESGTMARLLRLTPRYFTLRRGAEVAPSMGMHAAPEALRKKSLRRHERGLQKLGQLHVETFTHATDILPRLDGFFEQHVRRRADTDHPSLFLENANREFYRKLVQNLDGTGCLRYTELRLDGRLAASHLGFFDGARFTWYKPAFDPALAQHSPGEVLLKVLIERACADRAVEFDFTIGDESFKSRFATQVRDIAQLHVTDSHARDWLLRARMHCTRALRNVVGTKHFNRIRRVGRRDASAPRAEGAQP
ncbi:MAG: GNAT family N-acetyltransferase [Steroidobacteraceae bacterium]